MLLTFFEHFFDKNGRKDSKNQKCKSKKTLKDETFYHKDTTSLLEKNSHHYGLMETFQKKCKSFFANQNSHLLW